MGQDQVEFRILFRKPVYPVIVISKNRLMVASNLKSLAKSCLTANSRKGEKIIRAIDSSAEEFWYSSDNFAFAPGFAFKRWTKKKIIELYNDSSNAKELNKTYPLKSLSNKRLSRIIADICELLKS